MLRSKKLGHGELLHETPIVTVRSGEESRASIGGFVAEGKLWTRREGEILSLKDFGSEGGGGDDYATNSTELEAEKWAKFGGEGSEGLVERGGEEVKVAEERDGRGARGEAAETGGGFGGF